MAKRKEYFLKGLACANCAAKIENEVGKLPGVQESSLNFMTTKLSILVETSKTNEITTYVKKIVKSHEPSVDVLDINKKDIKDIKDIKDLKDDHVLFFFRLVCSVVLIIFLSLVKVPEVINIIGFIVAYLLAGYEILITAGKNLAKGKVFDENFLMSIASLGAFIIGEQVEAVAVLVFYGVGELLQEMAVNKSKSNIASLMDIRPDYANLKFGNSITVVSPDHVSVGNIILVKPGEKIPLDGKVIKGNSFIDARAITGESVPVEVSEQDHVFSGTINTSGVLEIEVTKSFEEATVTKILELVQNAGSKKAKSEKFITKFARYYTPIVVFTAIGVALLPPLFGFGDFSSWLYRALSFLIISCPCALVISIPISFFGGIGGGAKHGILIKGGNYLDALNRVDTIVFDKTGTLTKGVFQVTKVSPTDGVDETELIKLAAIAECHSTHPIAKSIVEYYNKKIAINTQITEKAGFGVIANTTEGTIYVGNKKLMEEYGFEVIDPDSAASIVHVALQTKYMGYILISDEVKAGVGDIIQRLKHLGVKHMVMLTGDHFNKAKEVAKQCSIDEFHAQLLPQEKVTLFEKLKIQHKGQGNIMFVGDGINDAPVLAEADIGIAMGGIGSDAAIEAADVVIMNDDIGKLVTAIQIARKTRGIVTQNIVIALGIKFVIMILAFFGITSIWFAIFADVGVALIAILNAMRAMYIKKITNKGGIKRVK